MINKNNSKYNTEGGNNIKDKIFLLSIDEAENYFSSDEMRATSATSYAKSVNKKFLTVSCNGNSCFWLRSADYFQSFTAIVHIDGSINVYGLNVCDCTIGILPALWISYK